jgi:hypothetical protein
LAENQIAMNDRSTEFFAAKEKSGAQAPFHMMWVVGQFFLIPVATLVYGVEMLVKTMQEMQKATTQGMNAVVGSAPGEPVDLGGGPVGVEAGTFQTAPGDAQQSVPTNSDVIQTKEENTLSNDGNGIGLDKDLHDDMLKLVRYKILFVKREYEHAFPEKEDLVSDNMDGAAFTAWKVAEFIQELHLDKEKEKNDPGAYRDHIRIPGKWREKHYPSDSYHHKDYLTGLPEGDKKYLRVYYEVLDRYPREKFKYEEQQIRVLEQIRDKMPAQAAAPPVPAKP